MLFSCYQMSNYQMLQDLAHKSFIIHATNASYIPTNYLRPVPPNQQENLPFVNF